ncbi:MAG: hypothetical protein HQL37_03005 [Alphaproteobacteria bacterium]|nr:hypothetical protein [Alphaproteobacteria bacterium]
MSDIKWLQNSCYTHVEPTVSEMLNDPICQLLMKRDGLSVSDVLQVVNNAQLKGFFVARNGVNGGIPDRSVARVPACPPPSRVNQRPVSVPSLSTAMYGGFRKAGRGVMEVREKGGSALAWPRQPMQNCQNSA